jgi:hypothetical protein
MDGEEDVTSLDADEKVNFEEEDKEIAESGDKKKRREIAGNLTYATAPGPFAKALDAIISAERPDKFSGDFVETILKIPGGSGRQVPPILKRIGFLDAAGSPTERYSRFKSDSGRSRAALEGLKQGFSEMFRRKEYSHRLTEAQIKDLIIEITGLKKNDNIVSMIASTFQSLSRYCKDDDKDNLDSKPKIEISDNSSKAISFSPALQYHINIQLPETSDVRVYNAIFKSIRENLFQ